MPFCAVGLRRHGVRMPPAEGGRQVAPWKIWDGGNTWPLRRSLAIFRFVLFSLGFGYFPLTGSSPFPLPRASKQVCGPTRRKRWSWSGKQDIPHHKMLSFYFTMKIIIIILFSLNISWGYLQKKIRFLTFHPEKCCAIFLSLKNIPLTLHADFILFFFSHSQHCLSDVWDNSPSFGDVRRQTSGCEWPDCARQQ